MARKKLHNLNELLKSRKNYISIRNKKFPLKLVSGFLSDHFLSLSKLIKPIKDPQRRIRISCITSSNIHRVCKHIKEKSVQNKLDWFTLNNNHFTKKGKQFEKIVCNGLSNTFSNIEVPRSLFFQAQIPWLGASPDAMITVMDCPLCITILHKLSPLLKKRFLKSLSQNRPRSELRFSNP